MDRGVARAQHLNSGGRRLSRAKAADRRRRRSASARRRWIRTRTHFVSRHHTSVCSTAGIDTDLPTPVYPLPSSRSAVGSLPSSRSALPPARGHWRAASIIGLASKLYYYRVPIKRRDYTLAPDRPPAQRRPADTRDTPRPAPGRGRGRGPDHEILLYPAGRIETNSPSRPMERNDPAVSCYKSASSSRFGPFAPRT